MSSTITSIRNATRVGKYTMFDFAAAMTGGALVARLVTGKSDRKTLLTGALMSIPIGVFVHSLLGIKTPLNTTLEEILVVDNPVVGYIAAFVVQNSK